MVQPIDYTIDVQTPFQAALQGYQTGAAIRTDMQQQQQQEAALRAQQQKQADLAALYQNPTPQNIARLSLKYPELSEQFKRSNDMLTAEQQRNTISQAIPVYAAIMSGQPEIASKSVRDIAASLENSGEAEQAKHTRVIADLIDKSPQTAQYAVGSWLSSLMGPDKFAETFGKLGAEGRARDLQPAAVKEAEAKASSAATAAKFAESKAVMDLKLSEAQINKWAADTQIARENARIAAITASIARENNDLKRQELQMKRDEAIQARDDKLRAKVADVETARSTMDNFLNTADRLLSLAVGKDGKVTSTLRAAAGPVDARMPTMQTDVADLEALVETLGSQAFLSQIPAMKGTGNLSEKEGDKLQSALANLNLKQGPDQFVANVREAQRLMLKARGNLATRYGVPDNIPDRPEAAVPGLPAGFKILGKEQ